MAKRVFTKSPRRLEHRGGYAPSQPAPEPKVGPKISIGGTAIFRPQDAKPASKQT